MNFTDEMYALLQKNDGDAEATADHIAACLNQAIKKYEEHDKKKKDAQALADHFNAFVKVWYPKGQSELSGNEIIEILNWTEKILDPNKSSEDLIQEVYSVLNPKEEKNLSDMIKKMGW